MRLFLRLCLRPCFPLCTPRCVHFVQGEVHSVGNVNLISRRGAAARIDIHSHTCVRAQSTVSFTRRNSVFGQILLRGAILPGPTRLGKAFLPEDTGVYCSGPAELREPSKGEKDFPPAPLVPLVNGWYLNFLNPLTPSPCNFFPLKRRSLRLFSKRSGVADTSKDEKVP